MGKILYAKDFYAAWRYVPFLLISIVSGALCGVLNGIFYAYKDTKMVSVSVLAVAAVNTALNLILIKPLCFEPQNLIHSSYHYISFLYNA